jgi:Ca-activated chloride channel family protein
MVNHAALESFAIHRTIAPGAEVTEYALLRVRAAATPLGERPSLSVMLVIDTSGSMSGEALTQVIRSTQKIAEMLDARDALGVVAFSSGADTVSPLRRMTRDARAATQAEAVTLRASGNTNMSGGLSHAALQFPARAGDERQVMILLSDGQPNVGASTPKALADEVRRIRERGVAVSSLGYGAAHNDDVMIAVSDAGGGRYAFVADTKLAAGSFARALGSQRDVVLEGVELLLTPSEGVEVRKVFGESQTSFGAGGLKVSLSDLAAGDELNVVVELRVRAPAWEGAWVMLGATLSGRAPVTRELFAEEAPVRITVAPGASEFEPVAVVASALAIADEARTRARGLADRNDFAGAAVVLRGARQALVETPGYRKGSDDPLDDAVEALSDEITNMEKVPAQAEYQKLRKAARDYGDFAQSSSRVSGNRSLAGQSPSQVMYMRKMGGAVVPEAWLVVVAGPGEGAAFRLEAENDIGRGLNAAIRVDDPNVSRVNSRVLFEGGGFWVIDCGSTNGTRVNGVRIERAPLTDGCTIELGAVSLRFDTKSSPTSWAPGKAT